MSVAAYLTLAAVARARRFLLEKNSKRRAPELNVQENEKRSSDRESGEKKKK
jgi:hypothetical protein